MGLDNFIELAKKTKQASKKMAVLETEIKNKALLNIAEELENNKINIFKVNKKDLENAKILLETGEIKQSVINQF